MTLGGTIIEALGLGASRDAKQLVSRLPRPAMAVATLDEVVARALERGGHRVVDRDAEVALSLPLAEDSPESALERLATLLRSTRAGGEILVAAGDDRARDAGLMLRAGLMSLRQDADDGAMITCGCVPEHAH